MSSSASRLYRILLHAYPRALRRELGPEMLATFEDRWAREGTPGLLLREGVDVLATGLTARWKQPVSRRRPKRATTAELFFKDLRHAARSLLRSPGFTFVAAFSLALGIGANSAIFTVVNAALLKPLPVERPEEIVAVFPTSPPDGFPMNVSYPDYRDIRESGALADLFGFQGAFLSFHAEGGEPQLVWGEAVTESYFSGLGVLAQLGRALGPEDAHAPSVVLSHDFWLSRFGGNEDVLGKVLELNGRNFEIVGVIPEGFTGVKFLGFTPELWVPVSMHEVVWPGSEGRLERRESGFLSLRGRLHPGKSLDEAEAALRTVASRLESEHPDVHERLRLHAIPAPRKSEPFLDVGLGNAIPLAGAVLLLLVAIVLLIACANVASLKLARAAVRERELAVRVSLGASRSRLVRQIALESILLAGLAGLVGIWLGERILQGAVHGGPVLDFSIDYGFELDGRVVAFTAAVTLLAALLSGLLPSLTIARRDPVLSLKAGGSGRTPMRLGWRRFLVVPQVALSLVALVSAGLFVRSFHNASSEPPGFVTEGVLLCSLNLDLEGYDQETGRSFLRTLLERVRSLAGVEAASFAFPLPLDAYSEAGRIFPESGSPAGEEAVLVFHSIVGEGYFDTMGTRLLSGRAFHESDESSRPVAIVNETLARHFWPGENALGKRFRSEDGEPVWEVIGVAQDGKYLTLGEEPRPYFYLPLAQSYRAPLTLIVKTSAPPRTLEPALRAEVRALDPTLPLFGVKTMEEFLSRSLSGLRALALAISIFAALAVLLATVGLYGLMSFTVAQKRHELGVRLALGASGSHVLALFLLQAARVVAIGLGAGLALAFLSTRLMESLLFGVEASSPGVFATVTVLLAAVALAGSYFPSRRATKIDPLAMLRHD